MGHNQYEQVPGAYRIYSLDFTILSHIYFQRTLSSAATQRVCTSCTDRQSSVGLTSRVSDAVWLFLLTLLSRRWVSRRLGLTLSPRVARRGDLHLSARCHPSVKGNTPPGAQATCFLRLLRSADWYQRGRWETIHNWGGIICNMLKLNMC